MIEVRLIGKNNWQKAIFVVLISGLIFAALHKWSTVFRVVLQLVLFGYVVWEKRSEVAKSLIRMPLLPVTLYVLYVGVTILFSVDRLESAQSWVRLVEMFLLAISAYHLFDSGRRLNTGLFYVIVAFGIAFIMDIQWYLRKWEWGTIYDNPINFNHHNTFSAICIALLPIAVTFLLFGKRIWLRATSAAFLVMDLFLIYVLQSRTAQASLAFTLLMTGFLLSTLRRKIVYLAVVVIVGVVAVLNIERLNPRWLESTVWTGLGRTENWKNGWELIRERPVLGYGCGRKIYHRVYSERFGTIDVGGNKLPARHIHNDYLDRLFACGVIGLLLFLTVPATACMALLRKITSRDMEWLDARALLLSLAGTFFYFLADIRDGAQWGLMWFLLAVSLGMWRRDVGRSTVSSEEQVPSTGTSEGV